MVRFKSRVKFMFRSRVKFMLSQGLRLGKSQEFSLCLSQGLRLGKSQGIHYDIKSFLFRETWWVHFCSWLFLQDNAGFWDSNPRLCINQSFVLVYANNHGLP